LTKHIILFLAANPLGTDRLALDEEARAIQGELERSGHRDKFELVTRWAVQPLDLLRELRKLKPTVVHFSGHDGTRELRSGAHHGRGLFFQGADGRPQLVSTTALQETFSAVGSSVKLVVLNACYSEQQAEALLAHVDCVVGMGGAIGAAPARNFAIGFYGGLGERESVADAYMQGRAAISLEGLPDAEKPKLKVRDGIEAERFVLGADGRGRLGGPVREGRNKIATIHGGDVVPLPTTRSGRITAAIRAGVRRRSWGSWGGVAIAVCTLAVWLTFEGRSNQPVTASGKGALANSLVQLRVIPVESASTLLPASRASSVESAPATPLMQPGASAPVEPTPTLASVPRDCKGADVASPMCSYRGTLRKMNGRPMNHIKVELMGTDCAIITGDFGTFDFKACDPNQTRRLKHPSIFLDLPDGIVCEEIPLQLPPLVTEVRIDLKTCYTHVFAKGGDDVSSDRSQRCPPDRSQPRSSINPKVCSFVLASVCERACYCYGYRVWCPRAACVWKLEESCRQEREGLIRRELNPLAFLATRLSCDTVCEILPLAALPGGK